MLTNENVKAIEEIVKKGNTAEVKVNKTGIIVLEVTKKIRSGK